MTTKNKNIRSDETPLQGVRGLWICRILVGVLFIFSGLIKANDPFGFAIKLQEYFEVFHITFLNGLAVTIAIVLCALEMFLGFVLLIGANGKKVAWGLLLLIIFFSFLTFYSAAFKVVQTCGCFGDAIVLTPWQSFGKDLVLLLLILVIFKKRDQIRPVFTPLTEKRLVTLAIILSLGVGIYTYNFLPVLDFLPYKIGANIPDEMKTPPGAVPDQFEITYHLRNKKTKEQKVMTDKEYLSSGIWKDKDWETFGDTESKLIKKGFTPKIQDLVINDASGSNYTSELLSNPFYNLMIVANDLDHADVNAMGKLNAMAIDLTHNYNIRTVILTSTSPTNAKIYAKANHLVSEFFFVDAVPLKSMVRANPGILLLKNGTIINKWHYHTMPTYDDIVKQYLAHP